MGIVNVTPDSFSDGGRFDETALAVEHALKLATEGAHILDIGGESTRPGAAPVTEQEELDRVIPVVEALSSRIDELTRLSIDTRKPAVAEAAIAAGAHIWNDVSALTFSGDSVSVAAKLDVPIVLMHAQGDPRTMQESPRYNDVVADVLDFLMNRIGACIAAGISKDHLIADPGIGFGKTLEHNLALLGSLADFEKLDVPILLGASRKRFIAALDREGPADERLGGSLAAVLAAWRQGVTWFRVHDVAATRQALAVTKALETRR